MKRVLVIVPVLMILMASQLFGQVSQTAVPFLLIAPGARAGGMGETFVAIADDATATHWNPAGLGRYPLSPSWVEMPASLGQNIEAIALVENNMPEMNYKQYDVWAIIDGQLAKWDDNSWQTHTVYDLDKGRSIKSLLYRYTGLSEEEVQPFYDKLALSHNNFPASDIDLLRQRVIDKTPADYQYLNEINSGFDRLKDAWNDFKLNTSMYSNFEEMIGRGLTDGQFSSSELDSIAFGFENIIKKRSIDEIAIPYNIVLTSRINALEAQSGMLYVGTDDGFYRFDPKRNRWKSFGIADGLPSMKITALAQYRRKSILVGTDSGLVYFDGARIKAFDEEQAPPTGYVMTISAINDRDIWMATENDLYHFNGTGWLNYHNYGVAIGDDIEKIINKFYGSIALVNKDRIISEVKTVNDIQDEINVGDQIKLPYMLAFKGKITALASMGDKIWIGTQKGVILSSGTSFTHFGYKQYTAESNISINQVAEEFVRDNDPEKVMLLANLIKQYNNIEGPAIEAGKTVLVYANALGASIHSIAVASAKKAYIGTAFGVVEFNKGMWSRFPKVELAQTPAHTIKTEAGEIWFATADKVYIKARAMKQLTFMHSNYLVQLADDLYYEFFSFVYPTSEWGTFGLGVTFLSFGSQERRGEYGEDLGQFNSYDMAITLSYGTKLMENMTAGLSAKYINSHLADVGAGREKGKGVGFSFALDGGLLYDIDNRLTLASTITNIGPEIAYIDADQADPLPSKLSLAFAYKIVHSPFNRLTVVGEASKLLVDLNDDITTEVNEIIPHFGIEYWYSNYVSLRTGYIYDDVGQQKYFTTGASLQYNNLRFDFSYVPSSDEKYNRMGNTMRFSMNVVF